MASQKIHLNKITFANDHPFVLLGGVNVLEDLDFALNCAGHYKRICEQLEISGLQGLLLKPTAPPSIPSEDLAEDGLQILQRSKHPRHPRHHGRGFPEEAKAAAQVADIIQLPAFLAREADLVRAMAETGQSSISKNPGS